VKKNLWFVVLPTLVVLAGAICIRQGALSFLFSENYLPHRFCYLIQPGLVWTNVIMDGLIALSYMVIFASLFWMAFKLRHLPDLKSYAWIFFAFGSFIVACGLTHIMEIVTTWVPVYRLSAAFKVLCALASVPTAVLFVYVAPALARSMERFLQMFSTTQQEKDQAIALLISSEKLAVAGRISATVAHEISNPLDSVGNLLHLLQSDPEMPALLVPHLKTAAEEITRAGQIARSTLSLYRESSSPVVVQLAQLVESVIDLQAADLVRRKIRIQPRLRTSTPIQAYPGELRQIFINLIQNAAAAIGEDGLILVRVQPRYRGYSITIADNGMGIAPQNRPKIFSAFFTTKGEHGTGIGLWLIHSLVEKHGGRVTFRSRVVEESSMHGTLFNIWLPIGVESF
jgi:signal transduction histidine kinase